MYVDLKTYHLQYDCGLYDYHGKELMEKNVTKHNELSLYLNQ